MSVQIYIVARQRPDGSWRAIRTYDCRDAATRYIAEYRRHFPVDNRTLVCVADDSLWVNGSGRWYMRQDFTVVESTGDLPLATVRSLDSECS